MKRFYERAFFEPVEGGFALMLDEREVKTPAQNQLIIPNEALAASVCDEWNEQEDQVAPESMPLYSMLVTAIDKADQRAAIMTEVTPYIDGDLLFYRAPEPPKLAQKQGLLWNLPCKKIEALFECDVQTTTDLAAIKQSKKYHQALHGYVDTLDIYRFTVFHILVSLTGSPILACLGIKGEITVNEMIKIIQCEDDFYASIYEKKGDEKSKEEIKKIKLIQEDIVNSLSFNLTFKN